MWRRQESTAADGGKAAGRVGDGRRARETHFWRFRHEPVDRFDDPVDRLDETSKKQAPGHNRSTG